MPRQPPNKHQLNALLIARLKPKAAPFLVWDTRAHGLAIQVQTSGHLAWKYIYSKHGRRVGTQLDESVRSD